MRVNVYSTGRLSRGLRLESRKHVARGEELLEIHSMCRFVPLVAIAVTLTVANAIVSGSLRLVNV